MTPQANTKLPWFPFYAKDFLTDVRVMTLSNEQLGAYIRLLCFQWIEGDLPADAEQLAVLSGAGDRWSEVSAQVLQFFTKRKGGKLVNKRLDSIRLEREKVRKSYSQKGAKGGKSRQAKPKPSLKPGLSKSDPESESESEVIQSHPIPPPGGNGKDLLAKYRNELDQEDFGYVSRVFADVTRNESPEEHQRMLLKLEGNSRHPLHLARACWEFEDKKCISKGKGFGYLIGILGITAMSWWLEEGQAIVELRDREPEQLPS